MRDFFTEFDKEFYNYLRPIRDNMGYNIIKAENSSQIIINAIGIAKEDIKIEVSNSYGRDFLNISGETKNEILDKIFNFSMRFTIEADRVKNIEYDTKDGLLFVTIEYKEPVKNIIPIKAK